MWSRRQARSISSAAIRGRHRLSSLRSSTRWRAHAGLSRDRVLLGGDHLGPYPWRDAPAEVALEKACELVRACVLAGYAKIHLDASMPCADDKRDGPDEHTVARRAATMCRAAEDAADELPAHSAPILYVIGTEVPAPGGETQAGEPPAVTSAAQVAQSLEIFRAAFDEMELNSAWDRVIGMVVQPGVEFGENVVFNYDRQKARNLSRALPMWTSRSLRSALHRLPIALLTSADGGRPFCNLESGTLADVCISRSDLCPQRNRARMVGT